MDANGAGGRSPVSCETFGHSRDVATEVVNSNAGHDCERQPTRVSWIPINKPTTACIESCASTNTSRKHLKSATLAQPAKGPCATVPCALCRWRTNVLGLTF